LNIGGNVSIGGGSLNLGNGGSLVFGGGAVSLVPDLTVRISPGAGGNILISPVPEPSIYVSLLMGFICLIGFQRIVSRREKHSILKVHPCEFI
jgi:hypothetical protein